MNTPNNPNNGNSKDDINKDPESLDFELDIDPNFLNNFSTTDEPNQPSASPELTLEKDLEQSLANLTLDNPNDTHQDSQHNTPNQTDNNTNRASGIATPSVADDLLSLDLGQAPASTHQDLTFDLNPEPITETPPPISLASDSMDKNQSIDNFSLNNQPVGNEHIHNAQTNSHQTDEIPLEFDTAVNQPPPHSQATSDQLFNQTSVTTPSTPPPIPDFSAGSQASTTPPPLEQAHQGQASFNQQQGIENFGNGQLGNNHLNNTQPNAQFNNPFNQANSQQPSNNPFGQTANQHSQHHSHYNDHAQQNHHNPYAAPSDQSMDSMMDYGQFEERDDGHFGLLTEPRKCDAGRGITWLTEAFNLFKENWLLWIGMGVIFMLIYGVLGLIPIVGFLVNLLIFHFTAGFVVAAAEQEEGYAPSIASLFTPLQTHFVPLLLVFVAYFVLFIITMIPMILMMGGAFMSLMTASGGDMAGMSDAMAGGSVLIMLLGFLISMALFIPVIMCIYMAPQLIVLHDIAPIEAMKMSFKGCLKNLIPFLLFGLVMGIAFIVLAGITLGLALLVLLPIMMITYYTAYRDIWSQRMIGDY